MGILKPEGDAGLEGIEVRVDRVDGPSRVRMGVGRFSGLADLLEFLALRGNEGGVRAAAAAWALFWVDFFRDGAIALVCLITI